MSGPVGAGDAAEEWLAAWSASVNSRAAAAHELARRLERLEITATGAGGAVSVTVGGSGLVTGLRVEDRAMRWTAAELSAEILTVMRRAQSQLPGQVGRLAAETVGTDTETGRAVVAGFAGRFPAQPPDDGGPDARRPPARRDHIRRDPVHRDPMHRDPGDRRGGR